MNPIQKTARTSGALYFLSSAFSGAAILHVANKVVVDGDAAATARNVVAAEGIFRLCIASELVGAVVFIFAVLALYRLLSAVDKPLASLMVTLVLLSVPITFVNVLNELAALALLGGSPYLGVFNQAQREAGALFFLGLHSDGVSVANIFWGLWLVPFGLLVWRSRFLPRILGALLILNAIALVAVSFTALLAPAHLDAANRFALPAELGELWVMGWLLIRGVNVAAVPKAAATS